MEHKHVFLFYRTSDDNVNWLLYGLDKMTANDRKNDYYIILTKRIRNGYRQSSMRKILFFFIAKNYMNI